MAIKVTHTTAHGIELTDAYAHIESYNVNKTECSYIVRIFANERARWENKPNVSSVQYRALLVDLADMTNIISSLYGNLKTQAGYQQAIDC